MLTLKAAEIMVANTVQRKREAAKFSRVKAVPLLTGIILPLLSQLLLTPVLSGQHMKDASSSSFIFTKSYATVNFPLTAVRTWSWLRRRR